MSDDDIIELNSNDFDEMTPKHWPVPDSYDDKFPEPGNLGSFWEHRGESFHCGVDIYAPNGAKVIAIENGIVIDKGIFTSQSNGFYYNQTYYAIIKTHKNIMYKYAALSEVIINIGDYVEGGQTIGLIGTALNKERISSRTPYFIKELVENDKISMLHLELYKAPVTEIKPYSGGNYFGTYKPYSLINPYDYLYNLRKQI